MTSTAIDLSAIRLDQTSYKGTFRALIGVYSTAEVDSLIAGVGGGSVVWGDIGGTLSNQTDLQNALNSKQPGDDTLTALAGVTTAADQVIYATGVDTFSVTALSAFGRSLIDDASASAARTTLGLGDIATLAASSKQDTLVSGTNIKTINGVSVLGSGDIIVSGGIGGSTGAADNRVLRSDGTGGGTAQASNVTIDDSGNVSGVNTLAIASGSVTSSTPALNVSQTWNNAAVAFVLASFNVTATAAANGSKLLQIGTAGDIAEIAVQKVASAGNHTAAYMLMFGGALSISYSPEHGKLAIRNAANTADGSLRAGGFQATNYVSSDGYIQAGSHAEMGAASWRGSTRAFTCASTAGYHWSSTTNVGGTVDVGFNRNAAGVVEVNSGTTGTYRDMIFRNLTLTGLNCVGSYTVATLPSASANAGKEAQVTDASVTTYRSTVAGGGANRVKVFSDGTNWLVGG